MDELVLGIDIGTTAVKAAAFDRAGRQVFGYADNHPTLRAPGGIVEQDPSEWMMRVRAILAGLARQGLLARIRAVGITSQVNSHVFVGDDGKPLHPAIIWQDGRCAAAARALDAQVAAEDRMRWWGAPLPIDASHALARMAWMAEQRPEIWAQTRAVLLPKDYVIRALTGVWISDPMSNIGLVGPDLAYVPELLALVPGAAERLVPLADAADVAGRVPLAPGLPEVPVSVGIMDAWAGMIGVGMRAEGDAVYLSGTSEVLGLVSQVAHPVPGVLVFPTLGDITLHAGPTQSGGASVAWFCATFGVTPETMAAEAGVAGAAPLFLPHLAGERAPIWDAGARGAFLNLSAEMGRPEMARGVYEGVACSARLLLDALEASAGRPAGAMLCGGGGFRSDRWNQIRADMLGRPLKRLAVRDPGVLGAAALASVAGGLHGSLAAALDEIVVHDRTYEPDPARHASYAELFARYRAAYEALRALRPPQAG